MKILSQDLYRMLRETVGPALKAAGFKRLNGGMLGWTRGTETHHLSFWFQCDRFGWFEQLGSRFTLEFQLASHAVAGGGSLANRKRFFGLLSPEEREFVQRTNNEIKRNLPQPGPESVLRLLSPGEQKWFMSSYQPTYEPYSPSDDVWLHYAHEDHVRGWGRFFEARIVRMTDDFAKSTEGELGRAAS